MTKYKLMTPEQKEKEKLRIKEYNDRLYLKYGCGRKQFKRIILINMLGGECIKCGFKDIRALQLDHIKGDGSKDRKRFNAVDTLYVYYKKHPKEAMENLQVLCANCNWIKRDLNNESAKVMVN